MPRLSTSFQTKGLKKPPDQMLCLAELRPSRQCLLPAHVKVVGMDKQEGCKELKKVLASDTRILVQASSSWNAHVLHGSRPQLALSVSLGPLLVLLKPRLQSRDGFMALSAPGKP